MTGNVAAPVSRASLQAVSLTGVLVAIPLVWAAVIIMSGHSHFAVYAPDAKSGVEVTIGLSSLFGALVLFLFPERDGYGRLSWVVAGFVVLGCSSLLLGYLEPLVRTQLDAAVMLYGSLGSRMLAGVLFTLGLLRRTPRTMTKRDALVVAILWLALVIVVNLAADRAPRLILDTDFQRHALRDTNLMSGLTFWHWFLSLISLALAVAAAIGAALHYQGRALGGWLLLAMTLFAGAELHQLFWPTSFSPLFTTATIFRLAFTAVVIAGAALELRRMSAQRTALLERRREYGERMDELAVMKADFSAMLAHELANPIAAIRAIADVVSTHALTPEEQDQAIGSIRSQAEVLARLADDLGAAARLERMDFKVSEEPVPVRALLADLPDFVATLPGEHPFSLVMPENVRVWADQARIIQVLHNLLKNASKYSAPGTPIEVRVTREEMRVHFAVRDEGYGIDPRDMERIFVKFGRGRDERGGKTPGVGLGLYLSRRVVQSHRSDILVESTPGVGSTFSFDLEVAP